MKDVAFVIGGCLIIAASLVVTGWLGNRLGLVGKETSK